MTVIGEMLQICPCHVKKCDCDVYVYRWILFNPQKTTKANKVEQVYIVIRPGRSMIVKKG